jgi:hypothetical protein
MRSFLAIGENDKTNPLYVVNSKYAKPKLSRGQINIMAFLRLILLGNFIPALQHNSEALYRYLTFSLAAPRSETLHTPPRNLTSTLARFAEALPRRSNVQYLHALRHRPPIAFRTSNLRS